MNRTKKNPDGKTLTVRKILNRLVEFYFTATMLKVKFDDVYLSKNITNETRCVNATLVVHTLNSFKFPGNYNPFMIAVSQVSNLLYVETTCYKFLY